MCKILDQLGRILSCLDYEHELIFYIYKHQIICWNKKVEWICTLYTAMQWKKINILNKYIKKEHVGLHDVYL